MKHEVQHLIIFVQTAHLLALKINNLGIIVDTLLLLGEEELAGPEAISPEYVGTKIKDS
jgi:hypothetical protein